MKFFIINSFRTIVYVAYFAIILFFPAWWFYLKADVAYVFAAFTGAQLSEPASAALAVVGGLVVGWFMATLVCGLLVTLLDIRDDLNDRLPDARGKQ